MVHRAPPGPVRGRSTTSKPLRLPKFTGARMTDTTLTLDDVEALARQTLETAGASPVNAASVARSTLAAERDGIRSHGLMYVPIYAEHVRCGKVVGDAVPEVSAPKPGAVRVDAQSGFAHPAIDAGFDAWPGSAATASRR